MGKLGPQEEQGAIAEGRDPQAMASENPSGNLRTLLGA
jgi:hypothetical protein